MVCTRSWRSEVARVALVGPVKPATVSAKSVVTQSYVVLATPQTSSLESSVARHRPIAVRSTLLTEFCTSHHASDQRLQSTLRRP